MGVEYARVSAMLRGRRDIRVMPLPGIPEDTEDPPVVGVRILLDNEVDLCRMEATQYLTGKAKRMRIDYDVLMRSDPEMLDREITRQLIYRCIVSTATDESGEHPAFFPSPEAVRQLDTVMIETLFEVYLEQQNFVNPLRGLNDVEVSELADALGKEPGAAVILSQYDAPSLRSLVHFLAAELRTLLPGK